METTEAPLEDVERDLLTWAGRVAAGEAELLRLIGEWDAREGWAVAGSLSCAQWLSWKLGMSPGASRERVRVARRLQDLPMTAERMADGQLSYAQVRAITRVATDVDEQTWLDLARDTTAVQLEKAVRGVKRAQRPEAAEDPDDVAFRNRARQRWDDDGNLELTFIIRAADAPAVLAAIEQAQAAEQAERDRRIAEVAAAVAGNGVPAGTPEAVDSPVAASSQDVPAGTPEEYVYEEPEYPGMAYLGRLPSELPAGLDERIKAYHQEKDRRRAKARAWEEHQQQVLEAAREKEVPTTKASLTDGLIRLLTGGANTVKVNLLIDPMSGWARTTKDELLPPVTVAEILERAGQQRMPRIRPLTPDDLLKLDRGRDSRLVTPALRTVLGHLDGECCRFPGCTRSRKLDAHHVVYWRNGGRTDLANLVLLCARHHTVVHEQGFRLELQPDRSLVVTTKDGTRVDTRPSTPWRPRAELPTTPPVESGWNGDRLDLHHVAWVLTQHAA